MPRATKAKVTVHKQLFAPVSLDSAPSLTPPVGLTSQPSIALLIGGESPGPQTPNLPLLPPEPAAVNDSEPQLPRGFSVEAAPPLISAPVPNASPRIPDLTPSASTFSLSKPNTDPTVTTNAATPATAIETLNSLSLGQISTSIGITNHSQQSNSTTAPAIQDSNVDFQVLPPSLPNSPLQHPSSHPFPSPSASRPQNSFYRPPYFHQPSQSVSSPLNLSFHHFPAPYSTPSPNFPPIKDLLTEVHTLKTRLKILELTPEERERWDETERYGVAYEEILNEFYYRLPRPRPRPGLGGFHARNHSSPSGWNPGRGNGYYGERRNGDDGGVRGRGRERWRGGAGYGRENSTGGVPKARMGLRPESETGDDFMSDYNEIRGPRLQPMKGMSPFLGRKPRSVPPQSKRDVSPSPRRQLRGNSPSQLRSTSTSTHESSDTESYFSSRRARSSAPKSPEIEPESPVTEPDSPIPITRPSYSSRQVRSSAPTPPIIEPESPVTEPDSPIPNTQTGSYSPSHRARRPAPRSPTIEPDSPVTEPDSPVPRTTAYPRRARSSAPKSPTIELDSPVTEPDSPVPRTTPYPRRARSSAPRSPIIEPESPVTEPPTPIAGIEPETEHAEPTQPVPENGCHYILSAGGVNDITVIYPRDSLPHDMQGLKEEREVIKKALEGWNRGEVDTYGIKPSKRAHAAIIYPDPPIPLPRKKLQISLSFTPIIPSTSSSTSSYSSSPLPTAPENIITDINIYIWAQNGTFKDGPLDWYKVGPEGVAMRHDGLVEVARLRAALGSEVLREEKGGGGGEGEEWEDESVSGGEGEGEVVDDLDAKGLARIELEGRSGEEESRMVGGLVEEIFGERERESGDRDEFGEGELIDEDEEMKLAGFI